MKKIRYLLLLLIVCISFHFTQVKAFDYLISLSNGIDEVFITDDTTIAEIETKLGKAKLITPSAFGGNAYAFYTNNNYDNYLYLETTEEGKITTFGSFDETFKTSTYSYGDEYPFKDNSSMVGYLPKDNDDNIIAGMLYNQKLFYSGKLKSNYKETFLSDETKFLKGFVQQSVLMYNAYRKHLGYDGSIKYNEDLFYINEQFKEFGTDLYAYLLAISKNGSGKTLGINYTSSIDIAGSYYLLNPLMIARYATSYKDEDLSEVNEAVISYNSSTKGLRFTLVRKDILEPVPFIELTKEEDALASNVRSLYMEAMEKQNSVGNNIYSSTPVSDEASKLKAGILKDDFAKAMLLYVNAIRVGGGLNKFTFDEDAYDVASHIATLTAYRMNILGLELTHQPSKPTGVSDEFYYRAVNWANYSPKFTRAYAENIGHSNYSSYNDYTKTINVFVDDSTEVGGIHLSHRQKILSPIFSIFGYGFAERTYANEFAGSDNSDVEIVSWPNKGVTLMEFLDNRVFYWSAQFFKNYNLTDKTQVIVTNLNTKQSWTFNPGDDTYSHSLRLEVTGTSSDRNRLFFRDSTLYPRAGEVYQIKLTNLTESSTGKPTEYTYRSAFINGNINVDEKISSLKISVPTELNKNNDYYEANVGNTYKLNVKINDTNKKEKYVIWSSSNPNVVKVLQNGLIEVLQESDELVTITLYNEASGLRDTIKIKASDSYEIKLDTEEITLNKGEEQQLKVTILPKKTDDINYKVIDSNIVSVSEDGLVHALKGGNTTIEVSYKNITKIVNVNVYEVSLENHKLSLGIGNHYKLKSTIITNEPVTWSSTNTSVATVDQEGNITALSKGKTTIKVTTKSGLADECELVVSDVLKGDLNENGSIQVADALEALYFAIGEREVTERKLAIGDFNGDKSITVYDALEILKIFVKQ